MRLVLLIAAVLLSVSGSIALAQSRSDESVQSLEIIRVQAADPGVRQQLGLLFGHFNHDVATGIAQVESNALERARLSRLGIAWSTDVEATAAFRAYARDGIAGLRAIPGFGCYRTVEETFDSMDTLVADYPDLASTIDIGDSWRRTQNPDEGYPLRVLRLGSGKTPGAKPTLFAMSSVHAREYTPAELMTRFAEELLAGYGVDADATWLLDHHEFHLLLQANPDGRKHAETGLWWRKNENMNHCPASTPGIDLNRNYPWTWDAVPGGSSGSPCSEVYRGPAPGSEPETVAVFDYLETIFPDRRDALPHQGWIPADVDTQGLFLDMHSYSRLVLWPWGGPGLTGNDDALTALGRRLAWFNDYEPMQSVGLYPTDGTTIDHAYGEFGVPAYTFELGTSFFQSCSDFENTIAPDNLASLRYAARTLHAPYILPAGPDAYDVAVDRVTVRQGEPLLITATVSDSRYRSGQGTPPVVHDIAGATVFVDQPPWDNDGPGLDMVAADGGFDSPTEAVQLQLDTTQLPPGNRILFVQGHDAAGEAGPPSAVFVTVWSALPCFSDACLQ